jgi:hypothetical protein
MPAPGGDGGNQKAAVMGYEPDCIPPRQCSLAPNAVRSAVRGGRSATGVLLQADLTRPSMSLASCAPLRRSCPLVGVHGAATQISS